MHLTATDLRQKKCVPCEGGTTPLTGERLEAYIPGVEVGWHVIEQESKLQRVYKFGNFLEAMKFVTDVAEIAETDQHHPDIAISYATVTLTLTTHAIGGLSENDFILAAKIDQLHSADTAQAVS